jgi:hypothetical protein
VPNERQTGCILCPALTTASLVGDTCVCDSSSYNASDFQIECYESSAVADAAIGRGEALESCIGYSRTVGKYGGYGMGLVFFFF